MDELSISKRVAATILARRRVLQLGAGAVALSIMSPMARAQAYPAKPIKVIVPNLAGSGVDVPARAVTQHLSAHLGQPLVIENRPGAGTTLGAKAVAGAEADGYTLFIGSIPTLAIGAALYASAGYDPIASFAPVASLSGSPFFLVIHPSVPAKSLQEFVGHAKANPSKLTFGFGIGTHPHVLGEHFKVTTETEIISVPYRASAQSLTDLLSGRIQMNVGTASTLLPLIQQGKVKALAFTGTTRSRDLPEVPTMSECGFPQLTTYNWQGLLAPAGTSNAVIERLRRAVHKSLSSAEVQAALEKLGLEPQVTSPEELSERLASEVRRWPPIVKAAGMRPE
jgi:tripartite-type tricarboxylate transporter receptor subunit TctC